MAKISSKNVDIILSDVKLDKEYAFDISKAIKDLPPIIFFSGIKDASLYDKSKVANPYIYLSKPFDEITLKSAIEGALRTKQNQDSRSGDIQIKDQHIFVRANGQMINLIPSEVNYIQSEGNYVYIFTTMRKLAIRSSIKNVLTKLESDLFQQVHRGFAVNVLKINEFSISQNYVQINSNRIPVGRKYKKQLKEKLSLL